MPTVLALIDHIVVLMLKTARSTNARLAVRARPFGSGTQQACARGRLVEPVNLHALVAGFVARHDADVAAGEGQSFGKERDEGVIRGALDGRRRQADENRAAPRPVNARAGRARDHADIDDGRQSLDRLQTTNYKLQTTN